MVNCWPNLKVGDRFIALVNGEYYNDEIVSLGNIRWDVEGKFGMFHRHEIIDVRSNKPATEHPVEATKTGYKANIYAKNTDGSKALESYITVDLTDASKGVDSLLKLLDNKALHSVEIYKE